MSWLGDKIASGVGGLVSSIGGVADRFIQTADEKAAFTLEVEKLIQKRDSEIEQTIRAELQAKERILTAELNQGDNYTKRARPTVVYAGLGFIFINYVLFPFAALIATAFDAKIEVEPLADLPTQFWAAWGGICATWSIGRSMEKRGTQNAATRAVTGSKSASKLLE